MFCCLSHFKGKFPAKSKMQRVFRILPNGIKIFKKSTIRKVVKTLILHINNSRKLLSGKKCFNKKTGKLTFLAKIEWSIFRIHMNFFRFSIFFFFFLKTIKSRNLDMFQQKDYALHSTSCWVIDRKDSQIRLKISR